MGYNGIVKRNSGKIILCERCPFYFYFYLFKFTIDMNQEEFFPFFLNETM